MIEPYSALARVSSGTPVLYWFTDDERVLYVGMTSDLQRRIREHRHTKKWWHRVRVIHWVPQPSVDAALRAEVAAIKTLRPIYNQQHREANALLDLLDMFIHGYTDAPMRGLLKAAGRKATQ
jgi:predicted GIY-YIG superfamily endonuclease